MPFRILKNDVIWYDATLIYSAFAKSRKTALAYVFVPTKQAFNLSAKYFQQIMKQLSNSVLAGFKESLRPWFVLRAEAGGYKHKLLH